MNFCWMNYSMQCGSIQNKNPVQRKDIPLQYNKMSSSSKSSHYFQQKENQDRRKLKLDLNKFYTLKTHNMMVSSVRKSSDIHDRGWGFRKPDRWRTWPIGHRVRLAVGIHFYAYYINTSSLRN